MAMNHPVHLPSADVERIRISGSGSASNKRPAPRGHAAYPRKRAVTACQTCRARRTKCDNAKPSCSFCLKVGARCIQSPVDLSSFDPASLRILERLDEIEQVVRSAADNRELEVRGADGCSNYDIDINTNLIKRAEKHALSPGILEDIINWPCFQDLLGEPSYPARLLSILRSPAVESPNSTLGSSPVSINLAFEPRTINVLLDNFFRYCHVKNPILTDEHAVRRMTAHFCLHGIDWSPESCLVLMICALGTISTPFGPSENTDPGSTAYLTSWSYFQAARKRLGSLIATTGVIEAQCMFLAGVYSMCIFQISNAWRYFSQALACCQEFDFITTAAPEWGDTEAFEMQEDPPQLSPAEQVIYWSSWKSERENRLELRPHDFTLSNKDILLYPSFFPTPPLIQSDSQTEEPQIDCQNRSWYFYLTEISLRRFASRIAASLLKVRSIPPSDVLEKLIKVISDSDAEIQRWVQSLPSVISLATPSKDDDIAKFVVRGHLINLYELLYWPLLIAYISNLENDVDLPDHTRPPLATHKALVEFALMKHVERLRVNKPGFHHRHHGTWFMIRTCTRSALVLLRAACAIYRHSEATGTTQNLVMPEGWQQAVIEAIELNRFWAAEVADARSRLPQLEQLWQGICGS